MRQVAALLAELRAEQARLRGEFVRQAAAVHALQAAVAGAHGCAQVPRTLRLGIATQRVRHPPTTVILGHAMQPLPMHP